jgi:carbamate kinase
MRKTVLVAIGGNSLIQPGERPTVETQRAHVAETARALAHLAADGWQIIVTHGNGPQVGAALRRSELAAHEAYPLPLDLCVASTQGEVGVLLQRAIREALDARVVNRPVATVLTQVVVSANDPAFARPGKPVGPFYSREEAARRRQSGWTVVEELPHGYRRTVASPEPIEVVEEQAIRSLVDAGVIVIAAGGGGVPVVKHDGRLDGVDAVIDKDLTSALLATHLPVDLLVMSTDVDRIYADFARPSARGLDEVTPGELHRLASEGHFPAGTMGPKVEAVLRFMAAGGTEAIVTSPDRLRAALDGQDVGTRIVSQAQAAWRRPGRRLANTVLG